MVAAGLVKASVMPPDPANAQAGLVGALPPDAVFIRGLEFEGNHGYTAAERRATRRFRVDLELRRSLARAAGSDRLSDTIDYYKVCEAAIRIGTQSTFRLLEALAGSIAGAVHELYPDVAVIVDIDKLAPPCPGVPASCGVRLGFAPRDRPGP